MEPRAALGQLSSIVPARRQDAPRFYPRLRVSPAEAGSTTDLPCLTCPRRAVVPSTQLDSFMKGWLFQLFEAKWERWVRIYSFALLANESCLAISLSLLASPTLLGYGGAAGAFARSDVPPAITAAIASFYLVVQVMEAVSLLAVNFKRAIVDFKRVHPLASSSECIRRRSFRIIKSFVLNRIDNWTLVGGARGGMRNA